MIPQAVNPRRRYQGREPGQEFVGREEEEQRSPARTLHPIDEPALLALREPLQRERRSQEVAKLVDCLEVLTVEQASSKLRKVLTVAEARERPAEMPSIAELRELAVRAARAKADAERKAREAAAAEGAAKERRRLEIEDLRRQGKWKTHEDTEREQREAYQRSQQGLLGKLKDLVAGEG